jgi:hypothetical protein
MPTAGLIAATGSLSPAIKSFVAMYRELPKTHKPKSIGMF